MAHKTTTHPDAPLGLVPFAEKLTLKFEIAGCAAARAFLEQLGLRPTPAQLDQIARHLEPLVADMVADAGPQPHSSMVLFEDLFQRSCTTAIEIAAQVVGLTTSSTKH